MPVRFPFRRETLLRVAPIASLLLLGIVREALCGAAPGATAGGKIAGNVRLEGRVRVTEDLLVLPGGVLTLAPGTILEFDKGESTKVDPEYFFGGTELVVRGTLRAEGARFVFRDRTGGVVVDGGSAELAGCAVTGAEVGVTVLRGGRVATSGATGVSACRVGVALFPAARWTGTDIVRVEGNEVGIVRFPGAAPLPPSFRVGRSEEAERVEWGEGSAGGPQDRIPSVQPVPAAGARRLPDMFLDRNMTLEGDVIVEGVVRVGPGVTLTIRPGSRLFFAFRDTDGDGIGENGLFLQGSLDARGTAERPIGFYPLDGAGAGRWDAINFMASEQGGNVLANVEIVGGYRGLHAHFSRIRGRDVRIRECWRGVQFQESEVEIAALDIARCLSALRWRDSDVTIRGLRIRDTVSGGNVFRSRTRIEGPDFDRPGWFGLRLRDSRVEISHGRIRGGFSGVSVQEGVVRIDGTTLEEPGLAGFALLEGDVRMKDCRIAGSRVDAISATTATVGVTGGALSGYARYAVKLGGAARVTLRSVAISGGGAPGGPFFDGTKVGGLGVVRVE